MIEGPVAVMEALRANVRILELFVSEEASEGGELLALAERAGVPAWTVGPAVVAALSDARTPQGVVAVARAPQAADVPIGADLVLVLAGVADPGNAGTLMRSAVAAGADAVVFGEGSVDPLGPKTVRASAGALFHLSLVRSVTLENAISQLRDAGLQILGTDARAPVAIDRVDLARPVAFVVGNEAWGLPEDVRKLLDEVVSIPMPGPTESLNVGVAGSILLFEAVRQRRARV